MAITALQRQQVLSDLEQGKTLRAACRAADINNHARWFEAMERDPELADQYARARHTGYMAMADDILDVADDDSVDPNSRRLMVDSRKWLLSKALPKAFGDRIDLTMRDKRHDDLTDDELAAVLAARPTQGRSKTD